MRSHHGHHTAPTSRRMGRFSSFARPKAAAPQGYQSTGWEIAGLRYGELSPERWFASPRAGPAAAKPKLKTIANAKIIRMKHQIRLAGISFNRHHFIFKEREPLLIAERPEIRLSSIHRNRETALAISRAAFLNVEIVNLPTGCCDAFSASFAGRTSERRCQKDLRIRHSPVGFPA